MKQIILHITTHMGGGVGKVLSETTSFANQHSQYQHKLLLLEKPEKMNFLDLCHKNQVPVIITDDKQQIAKEMAKATIVQLEWWHHPKMAEFLANFPDIPIRLTIWSHISGCNYPFLPVKFLSLPDAFILSSPYSFDNPYWNEDEKAYARRHGTMIHSSGGFTHIRQERKEHKGFVIGYMGTQSFAKLHPEFVSYCKAVTDIPNVKFVLVGDQNNQGEILQQAERAGIGDKFEFIAYTNDVSAEFARFDLFGYLLNPEHFGTTENVLLEAMAAGLPVICLEQCAEKYLIQDDQTGLLVHNQEEYTQAVNRLYHSQEEGRRLGKNAHNFVLENLAVEQTVKRLHQVYQNVQEKEKKSYDFIHLLGSKPYEWFLFALSPEEKMQFQDNIGKKDCHLKNCRQILREQNKSSIAHFARIYQQDEILQFWHERIK